MFDCTCIECGIVFRWKTCFAEICGPKCRMRIWRRTESGKAALAAQNKKGRKRLDKKVCEHCKKEFMTAWKHRRLCDECVPEWSKTYAQIRFFKKKKEAKIKKKLLTDLECPACSAMTDVSKCEKHDILECYQCSTELEYIETELIANE